MQAVTTIGLDIAKSVFQIHGVDAAGNVIVAVSSSAVTLCHSFRSCRRASLALKPALRRIIGHGSSKRWSTPCDDAGGLRETLRQASEERCCRR